MSKGNMLQGQARGKVGDLVFYVRQGIQQTRVRNRQPANPRTISTMLQRVKLAAVVGFYKRQAAFFKFALKKSAKESYYNAFVRYNLNIAPYLTKEQTAAGYQIAAPYIISDGDMPRVNVSNVTVDVENSIFIQTTINAGLNTWGDFRRAYNLLIGDMISFVIFNRSADPTVAAQRIVSQHVFDQESENKPFGYDLVGLFFTENSGTYAFSVSKSIFGVGEWYAAAAAVVTSRNAGGVDCSFAQLVLSENAEAEYLAFHSDEQHEEAAASYGSISSAVLDPKSFEGNYVDMVQFYSDAARKQPIDRISIVGANPQIIYFNPSEVPGVENVDYSASGGPSVILTPDVDYAAGTVRIKGNEENYGTTGYLFEWLNESGNVIKNSFLTITATEA